MVEIITVLPEQRRESGKTLIENDKRVRKVRDGAVGRYSWEEEGRGMDHDGHG